MATHPKWQDPPLGGRMSEQEFHALEEAFPDVRYEYIDGIASMREGGFDRDVSAGVPMSLDDFHALERAFPEVRYEYIDGIAYMMAGGTDGHEQINQNL